MALNVRAVTAAMRNAGIRGVRRVDEAQLRKEREAQERREKGWGMMVGGWFSGGGGAGSLQEGEEEIDRILEMGGRLADEGTKVMAEKVGSGEVLERWIELEVPDVR